MRGEDSEIKTAAFQSLCNWPDPYAADELYRLADRLANQDLARAALRGYMRIMTQPDFPPLENSTPAQTITLVSQVMELATDVSEKNYFISRLKVFPTLETWNFVLPYLESTETQKESQQTLVHIAKNESFHSENRQAVDPVIEKIMRQTNDKAVADKAREILDKP
ncbi:MAG: hypothetical protein ACRC2T_14580, partial [Thermoguttaceae bacterium]